MNNDPVLSPFLPAKEVQQMINSSYESLFCTDKDGSQHPIVCLTCDQFCPTKYKFITWKKLEHRSSLFKDDTLPKGIKDSYKAKVTFKHGRASKDWIRECLFSPRCRLYDDRKVCVCPECYNAISKKGAEPKKAIKNGWYFGEAPDVLTCLTDVEMAFITPVKSFGYCFSYSGGMNRMLKGTLGYFKVDNSSICLSTAVAKKVGDMLNKNVVFILFGSLTADQKDRAKKRGSIRPDKLIAAIRWLCENNKQWEGVDLDDAIEAINKWAPKLYDLSETEEEEEGTERDQSAIFTEAKESFSVFFPDKTMTELNCGAESAENFGRLVLAAKENGYDATVVADLNKTFTADYEEDNFVRSAPLQFPYGTSGPNTERWKGRGESWNLSLAEYADHIARLSNPTFHKPVFVLQTFNARVRSQLLQRAFTTFNSRRSVFNLREDLASESFSQLKNNGSLGYTTNQFKSCLESINRSLPHGDSASRRARMHMDSMQHSFGLGGVFLTVTPDDENSFLVTCYSMKDNNGKPIRPSSLSYESLKKRSKLRTETRLKFPGITAISFELILDIIIKDVIGWDIEKKKSLKKGLFGTTKAFGGAIEEQGRSSLHVHFILWIEGFEEYLRLAASEDSGTKRIAKRSIAELVDNSISTELIGGQGEEVWLGGHKNNWRKKFNHDCSVPARKRRKLEPADKQQLRNMRHRLCSRVPGGMTIASCPDCGMSWTSEETVLMVASNCHLIPRLQSIPDRDFILDNTCYEYTKPQFQGEPDNFALHAKADLHRSNHVKSCFAQKSGAHSGGRLFPEECRMRMPAEPIERTEVETVFGKEQLYYDWKGKREMRDYFEVNPKRAQFDCFVNSYVPAVSRSKIGGNSNARIITPGPLGFYTTKYPTKNTQEQNAEPYDEVVKALTRIFAKERKHEDDRAESLRIIITSAFAHNKDNVIGCSQASFLTRNPSRFLWSHDFAYVPLPDLKSLLEKSEVGNFVVRSYKGIPYAEISALHYLCRPKELEEMTPKDFFEEYEVIGKAKNRGEEVLHFSDTEYFSHPSVSLGLSDSGIQFLRPRFERQLFWISTQFFEDASIFKGKDILNCELWDITDEMEDHALRILLLVSHYRCLSDMKYDGSYVRRLRYLKVHGKLRPYERILNNIQNCRGNFPRARRPGDALQEATTAFNTKLVDDPTAGPKPPEDEEDSLVLDGEAIDDFLEMVEDEYSKDVGSRIAEKDVYDSHFIPESLDIKQHIQRGSYQCGHKNLCQIPRNPGEPGLRSFIREGRDDDVQAIPENGIYKKGDCPDQKTIVEVLFQKTGIGGRRSLDFIDGSISMPQANGSCKSIRQWSKIAQLDVKQARAFEVLCSSFVLSYYRTAENAYSASGLRSQLYLKEKLSLCKLSHKLKITDTRRTMTTGTFKNKANVTFIHGPGGSGKSAVINLLIEYAKEYCDNLETQFTDNTIVLTAMSGVAATLIGGRTTHSACRFNSRVKLADREEWEESRMLIIDEISFACQADIRLTNTKVKQLKDSHEPFGGIDVVFVGDMRQLEPVARGIRIYEEQFPDFHGALTCYIELEGKHRFKDDPEWGDMLERFRNGKLTISDIDKINTRVVSSPYQIPPNITYATALNRDRVAINTGLFREYLLKNANTTDPIAILASDLRSCRGSNAFQPADNAWTNYFFNNSNEDTCKPLGRFESRIDPALLLYFDRPMMITKNIDVASGVANGTRASVRRIVMKPGYSGTKIIINGKYVTAVRSKQVLRIELLHENPSIVPRTFHIGPEEHSFSAAIPYPKSLQPGGRIMHQLIPMKCIQFPMICNNATTGHKLQGSTVRSLFVHVLQRSKNWIYVVLSRVKQMEGLFLRQRLDPDDLEQLNHIPDALIEMIQQFREELQVEVITEEEFNHYCVA